MNTLEEWPLSMLVFKSPHLEYLKISGLNTTDENRDVIIKFAGKLVVFSSCLHTLWFDWT